MTATRARTLTLLIATGSLVVGIVLFPIQLTVAGEPEATLASENPPLPESSAVELQFQLVDSTADCRERFPGWLRDFGVNPLSMPGHDDPRPIEASTPDVLVEKILGATREWILDERFDRCVDPVCACILQIPGQEYAVEVSACEETPGEIDHRSAIVYLSDPELEVVDVIKWYSRCNERS